MPIQTLSTPLNTSAESTQLFTASSGNKTEANNQIKPLVILFYITVALTSTTTAFWSGTVNTYYGL